MSLQFDKLNSIYQEMDAYQKARDEGLITAAELSAQLLVLKNEVRKELGLPPVE